jgi:hypothetical protein
MDAALAIGARVRHPTARTRIAPGRACDLPARAPTLPGQHVESAYTRADYVDIPRAHTAPITQLSLLTAWCGEKTHENAETNQTVVPIPCIPMDARLSSGDVFGKADFDS